MEILPPKMRFDITALHCSREKVRKKGMQQRLSTSGAFKYVSEPPEKRAARDVASAAVEIDFKHICPLGPALCANVLDEFVRALLPRSTSRRAGRPAGSTPLRVRTVFFKAVMFPLH